MTETRSATVEAPVTGPFSCPDSHRHGSSTHCYNKHRCRCVSCREKNRATIAAYRSRVAAGDIEAPIRVAPQVRRHVRSLRAAGMTVGEIADLAGVSYNCVSRVANNAKLVAPVTADSILGVTVGMHRPSMSPRKQIPALGTQRRLQALVYMGWPTDELMRRIGSNPAYTRIFTARLVMQEKAEAVRRLYDELWDKPGPDTPAGRRAALRARRNGWHGPLSWDNPDDMTETPKATVDTDEVFVDDIKVERVLRGERHQLNRDEKAALVVIAHRRRWSDSRIAETAHMAEKTIAALRAELGLTAWDQTQMAHPDEDAA